MPPPPDEAGERFRLRFDVGTLDERITMRAELAALREDSSVLSVTPTSDAHLGFYEVTLHADCEATSLVCRLRDRYGPWRLPEFDSRHLDISYVREPTDPNTTVSIPEETRARIIQEYIRAGGGSGRDRLRSQFASPLRRTMDYSSVGRRTFLVEELPQGALPLYDRDPSSESEVAAPPSGGLPELPPWCVVGTWVRHGEVIGCISEVLTLTVTLDVWREYRSDGSPRQLTRHRRDVPSFHLLPGEPAPPRTVYQRLLEDDLELG